MKTIVDLNEATFGDALAAATTPVVVDFYAPWCGPCKTLGPLLEQFAERYADRIRFFKVNVDEAPALAERFQITGVPTLIVFSDGQVQEVMVGLPHPRELTAKVDALSALNVAGGGR
jgi:thioredoxin 1